MINAKGFTLTEIIVTMLILAAMAGMALPRYTFVMEKARAAEGVQILDSLYKAQVMFEFENGVYATTLAELEVEIPDPENFDTLTDGDIDSVNPIASVTRRAGEAPENYSLTIDMDGTINCTDASTTFCRRIGIGI